MATPSGTDSLIDQAKCFKCIPDGAQMQVQTYLLDQLRNSLTAGWEDLVFPAATLNPAGPVGSGTVVDTSGPSGDQLALVMTGAPNTIFLVTVQMPHSWVAGTRVYPHIHINPQLNVANTQTWDLKYSITKLGGAFPFSTTAGRTFTVPGGNQWKSLDYNIPENGIAMPADSGASTILRLRYTLTAATASVHIISFDVHYLKAVSPISFDPSVT